jgi:acetyl-CoA acyltransferase
MVPSSQPARQVVIVDGVRTPFGRAHATKGWLRNVRPDELVAGCWRELIRRNALNPALVDDAILGLALSPVELALNGARQASLLAGLPVTCPAVTVNRLCGSSLQALHHAAHAIQAGDADVVLVGGVERMTGQEAPAPAVLHPRLAAITPRESLSMGLTAEFLAHRYGISRADQDAWAVRSHQRASAARSAPPTTGLRPEILPVLGHDDQGLPLVVERDQSLRPDASAESLAALSPAFLPSAGTVTAGNSSPRSDGAAALLVMSAERAKSLGYRPLAIVRATAVAGVSPAEMGLGPVSAIAKVLPRAGLTLADIGSVELNEAFAVQALACIRQAGLNPDRVNERGGAIAIGHPLGASGARITLSLLHSLHNSRQEFGLVAMCIGMGQGIATLLQRA